jgi:hypothetical protein
MDLLPFLTQRISLRHGKRWTVNNLPSVACVRCTDSLIGKYVGNRPIRLKRADQTAIRPVEIGYRKAKQLEKDLKNNRKKPY